MIRERTEPTGPRAEPEPTPPPPRRKHGREPTWGELSHLIREHPLLAAAGAVLVGAVLVSVVGQRRRGR